MTHRIIVPPGIGDFSWLWSKLCTTKDKYHIQYADTGPQRLEPLLALLPKDKVEGYAMNPNYSVSFNLRTLTMNLVPKTRTTYHVARPQGYQHMVNTPDGLFYVEANTHLENGNRIETWMPEIKDIDFHYKIEGVKDVDKENIFIVHLSSFKMEKIWRTYKIDQWITLFDMIQRTTGYKPVFIGAEYDDCAAACFEQYKQNHVCDSLIGKTPDLLSVLNTIKSSKFFVGAVSSGLTMLANVLCIPSISWWPRPKLPQSWADETIAYKWFLWADFDKDFVEVERWVKDV